ncbi:hypothetical protein [Rubrobacter aplysinae]|uniref:hypothetical protein n=1 Tax=Rubrobacter aplysinae TaxID=909625 RepID=UPI00064C2A5B|nr:hypothetical protein [Rubrobacter aplysinae]
MQVRVAREAVKSTVRSTGGALREWLAWGRRGRANRVLFTVSLALAAFVTVMFAWASLFPNHGDFLVYFALYWVWGLCAVAIILGMAEYKTSPLRKNRERGHLFILLYVGSLLIITRMLNAVLYYGM